MKIGIIYGSSTGNTQDAAELINEELQDIRSDWNIEAKDICELSAEDLTSYEVLIAGIPTWDIGELQSDWIDVYEQLDTVDLKGIKVAVFGLGDAGAYSDSYQDAMGLLYEKLIERGGEGEIGFWPTEGYIFDDSKAVTDDGQHFYGLALDEEGEGDMTGERIAEWVKQVSKELELVKKNTERKESATG
ncbi:flavodoxin [Planctomycetota bacterium]|nr:flavodoxin [Planctomycetota bacterium]